MLKYILSWKLRFVRFSNGWPKGRLLTYCFCGNAPGSSGSAVHNGWDASWPSTNAVKAATCRRPARRSRKRPELGSAASLLSLHCRCRLTRKLKVHPNPVLISLMSCVCCGTIFCRSHMSNLVDWLYVYLKSMCETELKNFERL